MDVLKKRLKKISAFRKASRCINILAIFLTCIALIVLVLFPNTINTMEIVCIILLIMGIVKEILDRINKAQVDSLKNDYAHLTIRLNCVNSICLLLDAKDTIFLKGPYDKTDGKQAIIAVQKNNTAKMIELSDDDMHEMFCSL